MARMKARQFFAILTPLLLAAAFLVGMVKLWDVSLARMWEVLGLACLLVLALMAVGFLLALILRWARRRWDR